jgi:hypothetical protein
MKLDRRLNSTPLRPVRTSEHNVPVESRTQIEAGPVEYATAPGQREPEGYYAEHGEVAEVEPAAVYLVEPPPKEYDWTDWTSATLALSTTPIQVGDASRKRMRFVVRNLDDANYVYCARLRTDSAMAAFTIPPGEREEFFHNGPIAMFTEVNGTQVTYYTEYDVDDPD